MRIDVNKIRKTGKLLLSLSFTVLFVLNGYSQDQEKPVSTANESAVNYYRQFTAGVNRPVYRDFATSPLFYQGIGLNMQTGWLKRSNPKERVFDMGFGFSTMSARIPESNFIQPFTGGYFGQLHLRYLLLWQLESLSNEKNNIKVGGIVHSTQNFRINANLLNNAYGIENISNLMVSGQITRDISRNQARQFNLWLFKPTLKPVKRELIFQLNAGILNLNFRPGYAFTYDAEIVGLETNPLSWLLSSYKWSLNGWRFNTGLECITYLTNGNARSWSYVWDAANAPGRHETFQMASHQIRFTNYFHTKKR